MADAVVGEVTKKVMDVLFKFIGHHIGYLVRCKRYVENLEHEAKTLDDVKRNIEGMGQGIEGWLEDVRKKQAEVRELLEGKERVRCLSIGLRYRLGRGGCQMKEHVIRLQQRGKDFVQRRSVGLPASDPPTAIWYTHATDYERFGSRDSVFYDIMKALRDKNGSYRIGIHGLPGVGKTRMADEVAKQAKEEKAFAEVARATVSQTPDFKMIQQELAGCLGLTLDKDKEIGERAASLCQRLANGKNILVVLDDVWEQINLIKIGIPNSMEGGKVLLTTREQGVGAEMEISTFFRVEGLLRDEARMLFWKKVGLSADDPPEIRTVAEEVCKECGGLPLVILVVGGALFKQRNRYVWDDTLLRLKNFSGHDIPGMSANVYRSIELSFKYLDPERRDDLEYLTEAQSCLLHCCLFPEDAQISIDGLVRYGLGTRFLHNVETVEKARGRVHNLVV